MAFDFGTLALGGALSTITDPEALFDALPNKADGYGYLRAVQSDVLEAWRARRESRDLVIKTNTGGGKTIVGLLILQCSLNEGRGPAMYITADAHLASQVRKEAESLGLAVSDSPDDERFLAAEAILVVSIGVLINGKTRFGMEGSTSGRQPVAVGSVVIDDAHAAVTELESKSTLRVPSGHDAYEKIMDLFLDDLEAQSSATLLDIASGEHAAVMRIPFWSWRKKRSQVLEALHPHRTEKAFEWAWPLLADELELCQAAVTSDGIEIKPQCPPIQKFPSFAEAQRRVYLTATLAEDSILITHFDADAASVAEPVVPASATDLGDRLILAPMSLNPRIQHAQVREMAAGLADRHNVVVLVPSHARAEEWADVATATVSTMDEIGQQVQRLKSGHVGIVVIVNRYDGIDLPGDACRVLIIDGIPQVYTGIERREAAALRKSRAMTSRQVQRVEQGMGRGVRSRDDRCAVVILGAGLTRLLASADAASQLSPATRAQLAMSRTVSTGMNGAGADDVVSVIEQVVSGDQKFREASRGALKGVVYGPATIDPAARHLRDAYNAAVRGDARAAVTHAEAAVAAAHAIGDARYAGWLSETLAGYTDAVDSAKAQADLADGRIHNMGILRPITGAAYQPIKAATAQSDASRDYLRDNYANGAELILGAQAILDDLTWNTTRTTEAEMALADLAPHLGISSQRPEDEHGVGPDALWALGNHTYAVIEAKTGAQGDTIFKKDINQLAGSVNWCRSQYGADAVIIPVMVHRKTLVERTGTAPAGTKIVDAEGLKALKAALTSFHLALGDDYRNSTTITAQLAANMLTADQIFGSDSPFCKPTRMQR
ncbi:hypothetical protein J7E83_19745 [Arthrobacter sp. ISL-48]|uniref:helicase C-terminal domain-containing protein n=1 Tax=Arthrobacter sp. ISL-48 TaxID=2819110 RepID=UPI001BEA86F6|nr:helicase C-terminal domain-containing protein [Arthrobacter sp. ISL-48]MBT2534320.1 hypothetical protein [Arthrobacter sp. ISL-48]